MEKRTIVGIGESLWDCLPQGTKLGGAPVNFAYHVHQFGYDAVAISALGNDILGDQTRKELDAVKLPYIMPIVAEPTGHLTKRECPLMTSNRMWRGTIFLLMRRLKPLQSVRKWCVSAHWHSVTMFHATPFNSFSRLLRKTA